MADPRTILVVEDDQALIEVIKWKLGDAGFRVVTTKTAEGAILKLSEMDIDLLWLDHYLPGDMTGIDLISKLRTMPKLSGIPIFVVSNVGWEDRVLSYKDIGITRYFIKSTTTLDDIVSEIRTFLNVTPAGTLPTQPS